ncbi:hypothetical protein [Shimazuella alba]|uniref:Uncharacterized protein n=1 Tax=Shimazuella alba TaxID=2690964 RepID=A0A6I4W0B6_9BACL|nr:hypothetical protein [Shimazuella alba]MXQ55680.1 hypothetical protein [Shimazuella alba]
MITIAKRKERPKAKLTFEELSYLQKPIIEYIAFLTKHLQLIEDHSINAQSDPLYIQTFNDRQMLYTLLDKIRLGKLQEINPFEYMRLVKLVDEKLEVIESETEKLSLESCVAKKSRLKKIEKTYDKLIDEEIMLTVIQSKL